MVKKEDVQTILIIGIAGGLARLTLKSILKKYPEAQVIGVDSRTPYKDFEKNKNFKFEKINYTRSKFESLFRNYKFDVVFHLARIPNLVLSPRTLMEKKQEFNILGTNIILELCLKFKTSKVVLLSTAFVYGAMADNSVFLDEEAPSRASMKYADLRDVVEMDQIAANWLWKYQRDIDVVILRPCHIIGKNIRNTMTEYLKSEYAPIPADFNPMIQFINELDMAEIMVRAIGELPFGIYNVATDEFISIKEAKEMAGTKSIKLPFFLLGPLTKLISMAGNSIPEYLVDYLKYPCLISNGQIKKYLGEKFYKRSVRDTISKLNGSIK